MKTIIILFLSILLFQTVDGKSSLQARPAGDSIISMNISMDQAFALWKMDKKGELNFRRQLNTISRYLANKDNKFILSHLGKPDIINRQGGITTYCYIIHSSGSTACKNCSASRLLKYSGTMLVIKLKYDPIKKTKVVTDRSIDLFN